MHLRIDYDDEKARESSWSNNAGCLVISKSIKGLFCRVISAIVPVLCKSLALQVLVEIKVRKLAMLEQGLSRMSRMVCGVMETNK